MEMNIIMLSSDCYAVVEKTDTYRYAVRINTVPPREQVFNFSLNRRLEKSLFTVGLARDGGLLIVTQDSADRFAVEKVSRGRTKKLYSIGEYITHAVFRGDGSLAVGYLSMTKKHHQPAIRIFSTEGKVIYEYENPLSVRCAALTIDTNENVWFRLSPFGQLYRTNGGETTVFDSAVPEITSFAIHKDSNSILAQVDSNGNSFGFEPRFYLLERDGLAFVNPIEYTIRDDLALQQVFMLQDNYIGWGFAGSAKEFKDEVVIGAVPSVNEKKYFGDMEITDENRNAVNIINGFLSPDHTGSELLLLNRKPDDNTALAEAVMLSLNGRQALRLSCVEFSEQMIAAIKISNIESFREPLLNAEFLLLDDLEFILNKSTAAEELAYILKNRLNHRKRTFLSVNTGKIESCNGLLNEILLSGKLLR